MKNEMLKSIIISYTNSEGNTRGFDPKSKKEKTNTLFVCNILFKTFTYNY